MRGQFHLLFGQYQTAVSAGNGIFTNSGQVLGTRASMAVAVGDLDSDGDLDAVVANGGVYSSQKDEVWFNDGTGVFTDSGQALGNYVTADIVLGDLDGDGDLDVFAGTLSRNEVWFNNGAWFFYKQRPEAWKFSYLWGGIGGHGWRW